MLSIKPSLSISRNCYCSFVEVSSCGPFHNKIHKNFQKHVQHQYSETHIFFAKYGQMHSFHLTPAQLAGYVLQYAPAFADGQLLLTEVGLMHDVHPPCVRGQQLAGSSVSRLLLAGSHITVSWFSLRQRYTTMCVCFSGKISSNLIKKSKRDL